VAILKAVLHVQPAIVYAFGPDQKRYYHRG